MDNLVDLRDKGTKVFAYVSVGEVNWSRSWYSEIPRNWFMASNKEWGSSIIDLTQQGWHDYLVDKYLSRLWEKGYRGFFLDGLESYQISVVEPGGRLIQEKALSNLIKRIHQRFPGVDLILNRGFAILPEVGGYAVALAAESLFQGWDPPSQQYTKVLEPDRYWLLERLKQAKDQYGLQVIVIDYVDPKQKQLARTTAKQISDLGFTPWVANPGLDILGIGEVEVFPRRVLALYDGKDYPEGLQQTDVHKLLAMPLEYLGYSLDYMDVNVGLPGNLLTGQYAGIVTWFNNDGLLIPTIYRDWLLRQIDSGVKVAILGNLGFKADNAFLQHLGVKLSQSENLQGPLKIGQSDKIVGYEAQPNPTLQGVTAWQALESGIENHLGLADQSEAPLVAVFSGNWGGVALHPYVIEPGYQGRQRWIINPFEFLSKALDLTGIPVPDVTTENGRRLLLVQVDGDGAGNKAEIPGVPLAVKVIQDHFLQKYNLPSTVSIIEGETASGRSSDKLTPIETIARDIFKLNNVEIASHSYSHPSAWFQKNNIMAAGDDYHLAIDGYEFDLKREIAGSAEYINKTLAPENKHARVFLWTGDGLANKEALVLTRSLGLENMNGGGATIFDDERTMTRVPPLGYAINDQLQVYAPIASDHVYTNGWQGPFYGFNRVIETMRLTDSPLRLKPLHIHYHFYSGTKIASINALKAVYDWSIKQEHRAVWVSEYSQKVNEFQNMTLSRRMDGAWTIRGLNTLRTVRLPVSTGWPDLERSEGVVGVRDARQGRYVHLLPDHGQVLLYTTPDPPSSPYLLHSNGEIEKWQQTAEGINLQIHAHTPLEIVMAPPERKCYVNWSGGRLDGQHQSKGWKFIFPVANPGNATVVCY
ncbi:bifunctional glycoside hydrolase 114/ polysaccharide deacetylase family protein [Nitrosovibrio tenuis]|nr:endo alpha-1,4 polygalactosaminidase [Nitrosovibrio tenuis]